MVIYNQAMMRFTFLNEDERFGPWIRRAQSQPGWVTQFAVLAMVLVVAIPLALIALAAILVGMMVFVVLSLIARLLRGLQVLTGTKPSSVAQPEGGRRNVRIIDP